MSVAIGMHMQDTLLSPAVALATLALAGAALLAASVRARKTVSSEKIPLMGVLGAFIFAAQMINFPLPGLGTSGHLGGGVLLAILLGPSAATLVMAAILIVQCLIFQDGGLLALGCNIINMGVAPSFLGFGLYRLIVGAPSQTARGWRMYLGAWVASLAGVTAGAALVPLEAHLANMLVIPPATFLAGMITLHVPIGAVEGLITFAVLAYLVNVNYGARTSLANLPVRPPGQPIRAGRKTVLASLLVAALCLAGAASWFASTIPDGLETALANRYSKSDQPLRSPSAVVVQAAQWHSRTALLPEYGPRQAPLGEASKEQAGPDAPTTAPAAVQASLVKQEPPARWPNVSGWTSLAGVAGSMLTLGLVYLLALGLHKRSPGK